MTGILDLKRWRSAARTRLVGECGRDQSFGRKYFLMLSPSVLNSTRVPRSCRICFFVRLIMPWRLPRWACITLPVALTLKRFLAPDLVFSLGIWLSYGPQQRGARGGAFAAKMLVRALIVPRYFPKEVTRTGIATAALDQPGD